MINSPTSMDFVNKALPGHVLEPLLKLLGFLAHGTRVDIKFSWKGEQTKTANHRVSGNEVYP